MAQHPAVAGQQAPRSVLTAAMAAAAGSARRQHSCMVHQLWVLRTAGCCCCCLCYGTMVI
jgi:hypothetical protein